jgi:hypothetical protein
MLSDSVTVPSLETLARTDCVYCRIIPAYQADWALSHHHLVSSFRINVGLHTPLHGFGICVCV